jgi:hypothetical protein
MPPAIQGTPITHIGLLFVLLIPFRMFTLHLTRRASGGYVLSSSLLAVANDAQTFTTARSAMDEDVLRDVVPSNTTPARCARYLSCVYVTDLCSPGM